MFLQVFDIQKHLSEWWHFTASLQTNFSDRLCLQASCHGPFLLPRHFTLHSSSWFSKFHFFWNLRTTHKEIRRPVVIVGLRLLALVGWPLIESCQSQRWYHLVDLPPFLLRIKGGMKTSSLRCFVSVQCSPSLSWFVEFSTGQSEENSNCGFSKWYSIEGDVRSCILHWDWIPGPSSSVHNHKGNVRNLDSVHFQFQFFQASFDLMFVSRTEISMKIDSGSKDTPLLFSDATL